MNKHKVGASGEACAESYLKNNGYVILAKNYRFKRNEIDIICEKKGVVVFVEVKKRWGDKFGSPIEAVTPEKTKNIMFVAQQYLSNRELLEKCEARFDVIGLEGDKLTHIEDAFRM
ncbi:YraN family protein [candidate division WOR-3 bacterium]|nr:YraN family protein [candidate division WOR-3 bacterium]